MRSGKSAAHVWSMVLTLAVTATAVAACGRHPQGDKASPQQARARSAYEKAKLGYSHGLNDLTTALQAENTWRSVESQQSSAEISLMERSVQAFKALGGGWSPDHPAGATIYAARAEQGVGEAKGVR